METLIQQHEIAAAFIARILLAMLFIFQGYDAIFRVKVRNVSAVFENSFMQKGLPRSVIRFASWFTSYIELTGGVLLLLGLYEYPVLYLLGINLIFASIAFNISTPVWDMRLVFPRLVLLVFLLIIPAEWNAWSLDNLLFSYQH